VKTNEHLLKAGFKFAVTKISH